MTQFVASCLPENQIRAVFDTEQRHQMFLGGVVDLARCTLTLLSGALRWYQIPLNAFEPSGNGPVPRFEYFRIVDYGHTVQFGVYEAAADAILSDARCVKL
jgi:hypothetical protein